MKDNGKEKFSGQGNSPAFILKKLRSDFYEEVIFYFSVVEPQFDFHSTGWTFYKNGSDSC